MSDKNFKGTGVALVTPFLKDKKIDFKSLEKLVQHVTENGVNFLVALGTTAETPTLSHDEKLEVLNCIHHVNGGKLPLVCGIGGNNTQEVLNLFESYPMHKIDAILSVSPYYNKPTQSGIIAHFRELDKYTQRPIILYNVPGRTGSNMSSSTSIQLAQECKNIVAIKEASGNMAQCMELVKNRPEGFNILSGDDNLTMAQIACGFDGVISVAANCFTKDFCDIVQFSLKNDYNSARTLQYKLLDGMDMLFAEGNPAGVKFVLEQMGICENEFRLPVVSISESLKTTFKLWLKNL